MPILTINTEDLDLTHIGLNVEVRGERPLDFDPIIYSGPLLRYSRHADHRLVLHLGPSTNLISVTVRADTIKILDKTEEPVKERPLIHFAGEKR